MDKLPYDAVLFEMQTDDALSPLMIERLCRMLKCGAQINDLLPVTVYGNNSWAFGFIRASVADDVLDGNVTQKSDFVAEAEDALNFGTNDEAGRLWSLAGVKTFVFC